MRESGGNPEQYPLPYVRKAAARGASRSLGAILRRRSVSRGTRFVRDRTSRKTYDVFIWGLRQHAQMLRGKVGRGREVIPCRGRFLPLQPDTTV